MKCDNVDNMIVAAIVCNIILDLFALFTELLNQNCKKKDEQERQQKDDKVNQELGELRNRIVLLEKQLG